MSPRSLTQRSTQSSSRRLHAVVLGCHAALALAVGALIYTAAASRLAGILLAMVAIAPLLASFRSLATSAGARPWIALLLIAYAGGASIEVVASSGAAYLASVALLTAALELGVLLALIRRSRPRPQASRE
jgi:hypothetical protein